MRNRILCLSLSLLLAGAISLPAAAAPGADTGGWLAALWTRLEALAHQVTARWPGTAIDPSGGAMPFTTDIDPSGDARSADSRDSEVPARANSPARATAAIDPDGNALLAARDGAGSPNRATAAIDPHG